MNNTQKHSTGLGRLFLSTVLSLSICTTTYLGSTWAWFTDSIDASTSPIQSASVTMSKVSCQKLTPSGTTIKTSPEELVTLSLGDLDLSKEGEQQVVYTADNEELSGPDEYGSYSFTAENGCSYTIAATVTSTAENAYILVQLPDDLKAFYYIGAVEEEPIKFDLENVGEGKVTFTLCWNVPDNDTVEGWTRLGEGVPMLICTCQETCSETCDHCVNGGACAIPEPVKPSCICDDFTCDELNINSDCPLCSEHWENCEYVELVCSCTEYCGEEAGCAYCAIEGNDCGYVDESVLAPEQPQPTPEPTEPEITELEPTEPETTEPETTEPETTEPEPTEPETTEPETTEPETTEPEPTDPEATDDPVTEGA